MMPRRVLAASVMLGGWVVERASAQGHGGPPTPEELANEEENKFLAKWVFWSLSAFAGLPLLYRVALVMYSHLRLLASLNDGKQHYFASRTSSWIPWLKKNILYAPLFRGRHNKEFQISKATNVGTLPTRFQTFFLIGYVIANIVWCTFKIGYSEATTVVLSEFRNRTGVMSTVNMVPLILLAGRNNPLIWILGISFDTFNLIHRWIGRLVVVEAVAHTLAWMVSRSLKSGWESVLESLSSSQFFIWGMVGTCSFIFLLLHSPSVLRHAFYETFLAGHIIAAAAAITGVYHHIKLKPELLPYLQFVLIAIGLWSSDRALRLIRLFFRNLGWKRITKVKVEAMPANTVRVTINMPRPWTFRPGQHLYLYIPGVGMWQSHPFTIIWGTTRKVEEYIDGDGEKLAMHTKDLVEVEQTTMSLLIAKRTGFTEKLFNLADGTPDGILKTYALVEGPYGKIDTLSSYGTVVLVAGGVGITHPVPFVRELLAGYANGTVATRRITLVWVMQTQEHLEWIRPWMHEILQMSKRREVLKILLYVTKDPSKKDIISPSSTVLMSAGRPNFDEILGAEIKARTGTMAVTVCGSGSLSDDVRKAVRSKTDESTIDFFEEAFSW